LLSERLGPVGIAVVQLSITDFQFSAAFQQAIEAKVTAVQQTLEAENALSRRVQFEAKPKVTQVQAEAKGLELQKTQVTPELIRLRQIEVQRAAVQKWNGVMATVVAAEGRYPCWMFSRQGSKTFRVCTTGSTPAARQIRAQLCQETIFLRTA
jgi:SPFH domain / Band 7 family